MAPPILLDDRAEPVSPMYPIFMGVPGGLAAFLYNHFTYDLIEKHLGIFILLVSQICVLTFAVFVSRSVDLDAAHRKYTRKHALAGIRRAIGEFPMKDRKAEKEWLSKAICEIDASQPRNLKEEAMDDSMVMLLVYIFEIVQEFTITNTRRVTGFTISVCRALWSCIIAAIDESESRHHERCKDCMWMEQEWIEKEIEKRNSTKPEDTNSPACNSSSTTDRPSGTQKNGTQPQTPFRKVTFKDVLACRWVAEKEKELAERLRFYEQDPAEQERQRQHHQRQVNRLQRFVSDRPWRVERDEDADADDERESTAEISIARDRDVLETGIKKRAFGVLSDQLRASRAVKEKKKEKGQTDVDTAKNWLESTKQVWEGRQGEREVLMEKQISFEVWCGKDPSRSAEMLERHEREMVMARMRGFIHLRYEMLEKREREREGRLVGKIAGGAGEKEEEEDEWVDCGKAVEGED